MSTAAASQGLGIGSESSKQIEYKIKIPGKSKGAGMWIGDSRINGFGTKQREFMTNRDSIFRVGKTVHDKRRDKYIVELTWQGITAHDYGSAGE